MGRKQCTLLVILALISGLIGGALSSKIFSMSQVFAEKLAQHQKVFVAEEFRLVDEKGRTRAILGFTPEIGQPALWLKDTNGKIRAALRLGPKEEPALALGDSAERVRIQLDVTSTEITKESPSLILRDDDQDMRTHLQTGMLTISGKLPAHRHVQLTEFRVELRGEDGSVLWSVP